MAKDDGENTIEESLEDQVHKLLNTKEADQELLNKLFAELCADNSITADIAIDEETIISLARHIAMLNQKNATVMEVNRILHQTISTFAEMMLDHRRDIEILETKIEEHATSGKNYSELLRMVHFNPTLFRFQDGAAQEKIDNPSNLRHSM